MGRFTGWLKTFLPGQMGPDDSFVKLLADDQSWQAALEEERAFVYKHSPICHLSAVARRELNRFAETHSTIPIYVVDVLNNRSMSDRIENDLGILHESPQIILLSHGTPKWDESHWNIKADAMAFELARLH